MIRHSLKLVWNRKRANALVVAEIFISFLVVFAVSTGVVTFASNWNRPLGFDWHDVWDVRMDFDVDASEHAGPDLQATVMRMLAEARSLPQVAEAALSNTPPYAFSTADRGRRVNGRYVTLVIDDVSDDFANVMRMNVLRGRWFTDEDDATTDQPVVLDVNAALSLFGEADPIGKRIEGDEGERALKVVGVVGEYRKDGETSAPVNMVFRRIASEGDQGRLGRHILVRVRPGVSATLEETLVGRLQAVAPTLSFNLRHMDRMRTNSLRFRLAPLVAGGIVATFLISMVTLGLTGVLWQNVTRRTREIGVRRAMGASGANVQRQIVLEVALLTTIALSAGSVIVLQLPILGVFSIVTPAAFTIGLVAALATIYALTVLCALYPSRLASHLQPADALRYE